MNQVCLRCSYKMRTQRLPAFYFWELTACNFFYAISKLSLYFIQTAVPNLYDFIIWIKYKLSVFYDKHLNIPMLFRLYALLVKYQSIQFRFISGGCLAQHPHYTKCGLYMREWFIYALIVNVNMRVKFVFGHKNFIKSHNI